MNDRELLELAARAAGIKARWFRVNKWRQVGGNKMKTGQEDVFGTHHRKPWNPLTDDGDALRLAVQLDITIGPEHPDVVGKSLCRASWNNRNMSLGEFGDGDKPSAYRRAIVRAAAEIGKSMGGGE
ncbi:hypothetical protein [Pseudomonas aeruginosa]|uniref:hypothetical protein n=1 Tax=Pseudomonas aeruginosa TaxID=287 RepID=UPI0015D498C9|nr:hypothetical protein [Pseudomonas aeruginosa]EJO5058002.1 hypothetical protein [Pseudomonas aeruginosa]NYU58331.1 hypothetical protein [Pseudomonas aeruginosa]